MPLAVPLDAATAAHGGKAAVLGRLRALGLPVPDGFVVPAAVAAEKLPAVVAAGLEGLTGAGAPADAAVAVRSSAADEDGPAASAAGQYDSVLGVVGADAVVTAVLTCRTSASGQRAVAYRAATRRPGAGSSSDDPSDEPGVAVLVQRLVDARAAGVLFTGDDGTVVEASWGLGESVVQGAVDPDRFTVADGRIADRRTGSKRTRVDRSPDGTVTGTATRDVDIADRGRPCLDDATVLRVAALGERVAHVLGGAQDVEWAVDDAGRVWLLQARPVTAPLPAPRCGWDRGPVSGARPGHDPTHNQMVLRGTPGSGGRARGPARVVRGPDDFPTVGPGDVLVCRETDPAWTPLFGVVAAVVTETGGLLSHAAIVARELRLPAVLGVPTVTETLRDVGTVAVDGDAGTVDVDPGHG